MTEPHFEIQDRGDIVRIEPIEAINDVAQSDGDDYWIKTTVTVKAGAFSGKFSADFTAIDFEVFKRDIQRLEDNFRGTAKLEPLERQLTLNIHGDGLGHFEVRCTATDQISNGRTLSFEITFDQTELPRLKNELDRITKAFPITLGDTAND